MVIARKPPVVRAAPPTVAEPLAEHLRLASELAAALDSKRGLRAVAEALRLARKLGDKRSEAQALAIATLCHYHRGDYVSAVATGLDACATYATNDIAGRSLALQSVALAFFSVSDYARAQAAAQRAVLYATLDADAGQEAAARNVLGYALADSGRFEEALAEFSRARKRFRELGDVPRAKKATYNSGHTWVRHGTELAKRDAAAARACWRRAIHFYRAALATGRSRLDDAIVLGALGECEVQLGRPEQALAHLHEAAAKLAPRDGPRIVSHVACWRGRAECALGRFEEAERHLLEALEVADGLENDNHGVECREALATLAAARGDASQARHWRAEARRRQDEQHASLVEFRRQMRPLWDRYLRNEDE